MQVLKKISFLFWVLIIGGCEQITSTRSNRIIIFGGREQAAEYSEQAFTSYENTETFKAAMLLPLSGKASVYGKGMKNAAMMALEDADNSQLIIRFYDTKSTSFGAQEAARQAISDGNSLILGPLMSEEVSAIAPLAKREDIPVISFSTSQAVLQDGIYTLGLLGNEQIERIVTYAAQNNRKKIAILAPDNAAGINTAKATIKAALKTGSEVVRIGFYPPETLDFSDIVKSMTDYTERAATTNRQKNLLAARAHNGDKEAARELSLLKTVYTSGELDFDTVLIAESGNRLKSAAAMFGYYDVSYPDVLFMGTSVWENTGLTKETTLYHGIYPTLSRVHNDYFNKKYENLFGQLPNPLYSFAYDSIALASSLAKKNPNTIHQNITDTDGFIGINGTFRIYENGTNQHSLDIVEITSSGIKILDKASQKFTPVYNYQSENYLPMNSSLRQPKIFGKDSKTAYQELFNGYE